MLRDRPLPPELQKAFGHLPGVFYKAGANEWHGPCPKCGSAGHDSSTGPPDRFHMHVAEGKWGPRGKCRKCLHFEWADGNNSKPPSAAKIKEMELQREEIEEAEAVALQNRLDRFMASKLWEFYHNEMTDRDRWLWEKAGIPNDYQNLWSLGYMKHYPSKQFNSSALTIPHFDVGGDPSNLQYRLLQPPMPNDKYRYHQGLKHPLWLAEPDKNLTGICILCEGMKKGALVFIKFIVEPNNQQYRVVSLPSKAPAKSLYPRLSEFEKIYLVMDPDAHHFSRDNKGKVVLPSIYNMVENIEGPSVNVVTLPHKADDFFTMYGGNDRDFMQFLNHSREVKQSTH